MVTDFMQTIPMQTGSAGQRSGLQRFDYFPAASLNNPLTIPQPAGFQTSSSNAWWQGAAMPRSGPVAGNQQTTLYGDGRIMEADGGRYNFGRPGIFDLLNDKNIDVRGNFDMINGSDRMLFNEAGLTVGDHAINIRADGTVSLGSANPGSNDLFTPIGDVQNQDLGNGATLSKQGNTVTVTTPEYTIAFDTGQQALGKQYLNMQIQTGAQGVDQDQQLPTGVLGETFDADNYSRGYVGTGLDGGDSYQRTGLPGKLYQADWMGGKSGYIQGLYGNLMGHPAATDAELQSVSQAITQGGLQAGIKQIINSDEFKSKNYSNPQKAALVYQAIYQKTPDQAGISHYVDELNSGQSLDAVVDEILHSPDHYVAYVGGQGPSNLSNQEAVQILYSHFEDIRRLNPDTPDIWGIVLDPYLHRRSLDTVMHSDQFDVQTKAAAKRVLGNKNLFRKLDAANGGNGPDDKIGTEDFEAILNEPKINTF